MKSGQPVEPSTQKIYRQKHSWIAAAFLGSEPRPIPLAPQETPEAKASLYSLALVTWLSSLIYTGYNRALEYNDIYLLNPKYGAEHQMQRYKHYTARYSRAGSSSPHWRALFAINRRWFYLSLFLNIVANGTLIGTSLISNKLIDQISAIYENTQKDVGPAVGYSIGLTVIFLLYLFADVWGKLLGVRFREHMRSATIAAIYDKTMCLSNRGRAQYSTAAISSLVTTDVARIGVAAMYIGPTLAFPPLIAAVVGVLIYFLGVSALAGIGLVLFGLFGAGVAGRFTSRLRKRSLPFADQRVSIVRETISSMRILKYYGWQDSFQASLAKIRSFEESCIKMIARLNVSTSAVTDIFPALAGLLTFSIESVIGKNLSPQTVFPSLTLFNMIAPLSSQFAQAIVVFGDAYACFERIELFLSADEAVDPVQETTDGSAIDIASASFRWVPIEIRTSQLSLWRRLTSLCVKPKYPLITTQVKDSPIVKISNINLHASKGKLVMVVGEIGSGKTSLLHAIAGHLELLEGKYLLSGRVSTVLKNWSMNATVRDNITFGQAFDAAKYAQVVNCCQLSHDLQLFANGDLTEIGENGITLSGGQKARLALARCIYSAQDILLLDDVLSAVDSKVCGRIMEECIMGYVGDKTRIMTTHNLSLLHYADEIIFMDKNLTATNGSLALLLENPEFHEFYNLHDKEHSSVSELASSIGADEDIMQQDSASIKSNIDATTTQKPAALMLEERRERGTFKGKVIKEYIKAGVKLPALFVAFMVLLVCVTSVAIVMQSVFLNWWTSDHWKESTGFYIGVYAAIVASQCLFQVGFLMMMSEFVFSATSGLYRAAVKHIYDAPVAFFDTTPFGRIVNRFTNDLSTLDTLWFNNLSQLFPMISSTLGQFILVFVFAPWATLCLIPVLIVCAVAMSFYRCSSREIVRLQTLTRSTMFAKLTESIEGSDIIVAYGRYQTFRAGTFTAIDQNLSTTNINYGSIGWLGFRALLATVPIIFVVTMLCTFKIFDINASGVAMLVSVIPGACRQVCSFVIQASEAEKNLSCVERLYEYAFDLPQESKIGASPPEQWPRQGGIKFQNLEYRYREGLPLVLDRFNLDVNPGEKIGICGRTGAGKSSLISCLFRLGELSGGSIVVDGVDIFDISITELRRSLCIIPQESILFKGTIRSNLDPFGQFSDVQLWEALRLSGTTNKDQDKFKLDAPVEDQGTNFSLGERQLLTLSRALVKRSKVIALDEATANVDNKTDDEIQAIIAAEFKDSTILCIAHRLQTILGYDKIVVMDSGRVIEFGTPEELWHQNGTFRNLCKEANLDISDIRDSAGY